jgi:hypothetical protein
MIIIFTLVNFISILILYLIVLHVYGKYIEMEESVESVAIYQQNNERQLKNLVKDINYNDRYLTNYIKSRDHSHV